MFLYVSALVNDKQKGLVKLVYCLLIYSFRCLRGLCSRLSLIAEITFQAAVSYNDKGRTEHAI